MASTPAPPVDGEDYRASEPAKSLRLGDAERIAAERLGAAEPALDAPLAAAERDAHSPDRGEPPPIGPVGEPAGSSINPQAGRDLAEARAETRGPDNGQPTKDRQDHTAEPLASALQAAAQLTADANAAAEALENLQRLLQRQLPGVAGNQTSAASRADQRDWPAEVPLRSPSPSARAGADNGGLSGHDPLPVAALDPSRPIPPERRRFDIGGFLAGFALSCAFGVVLYLFMMAG